MHYICGFFPKQRTITLIRLRERLLQLKYKTPIKENNCHFVEFYFIRLLRSSGGVRQPSI